MCTYTYIPTLEMVILLKIKGRDFFQRDSIPILAVTHREKTSEVQIAVFSK